MKAATTGRFMAVAMAFAVAGLGIMVPGLLQAADYTWDGSTGTWASLHWTISPDPTPVAGPTTGGNTAAISGGTVSFAQHDTFGDAGTTASPAITLGTGATLASGGWFTTMWGLNLAGGTLLANGGANPAYPAFQLAGTLNVSGASASLINVGGGVNNSVNVGGNGNATLVLDVADVTLDATADLTVNTALQNSPFGAGSLIKTGAGKLALSGANTFSGNLVINGGTVSDTVAANTGTPAATSLGDMTAVGRQVQVNSGATLLFLNNDPIGSATVLQNASFIVDGGTVDHGSYFVTLPNITLRNGATLTGGNGVVPNYQTFNLMGSVTVSGTSGSTVATTGSSLTGVHLGNGNVSFVVHPTGLGPDLTVSAPLMNRPDSLADSGFTKTGAGTMVLAAANTYSGTATVSEGILAALSAAALPGYGVAGKVTLAAGAGLSVGVGTWSDAAIIDLINTGVYGAGTLFGFDTTAGNYNYDGSQFTLPAVAGLVKTGTNRLTVSCDNAFSGDTVLLAGTLALTGGDDRLSTTGAITVNGGTLDLGGGAQTTIGTVVLAGGLVTNGTLSKSGAPYDVRSGTVAATLTGAAGVTKTTGGTVALSGPNTYSGSTVVSDGTLNIAASGALLGTDLVNPASNGVLTIAGTVTVANNGGFAVGNGTAGLGTVNIEDGAVVSIGNGSGGFVGRTYIGGKLDGSGVLGTGILNINGGLLNVASAGAVTVGDGARFWLNAWGNAGAVLNLNGGTLSTARTIQDGAGASAPVHFNGGVLQAAASLYPIIDGVTALIDVGGAKIDTQNNTVSIGQALSHGTGSPDGGLAKLGAGTLTLSGANSYNGATVISAGTLRLGAANAIPGSGAVQVAGGVLDLGGFTVASGAVTLSSGSIINGSLNASSYALDSGSVLANLGGGNLVKSGAGTAVLYGDNTGMGEVSVAQGTLTLANLGFADCRLRLDASDASTLFANSDGTGAITASGQPVGFWGDLSGTSKPALQATAERRPTYVTGVSDFNGLPVLQFDGADDDITSALDINAANIPNITIMMVYRQVAKTVNGGLWGHDDGGWDRLQLLNFTDGGLPDGYPIATDGNRVPVNGMNTNGVVLYTAVLKNGVDGGSFVYINGMSDGASGLPAFKSFEGPGHASFTLANISAGSGYHGNIQIGEVLVFDTALTDTVRRNVEAYLRNKWLGVSDPLTPSLPPSGAVQVASGAMLNLDGASHTVASLSGSGTVANGTLAVTGTLAPGGAVIGTLSLACAAALNGATLLADVATDGSRDQVAVAGGLSLSGLTLQVVDTGLLNKQQRYTLITSSGNLSGSFLNTNLPANWNVRYDRTPGAGSVLIYWALRGTMIRVM